MARFKGTLVRAYGIIASELLVRYATLPWICLVFDDTGQALTWAVVLIRWTLMALAVMALSWHCHGLALSGPRHGNP